MNIPLFIVLGVTAAMVTLFAIWATYAHRKGWIRYDD